MEQRIKKVKLFRALKVVYYCLGLPLFLLAVMTLASQLYGRWPFAGNPGTGLYDAIKVFFNSPAMYSIWIALGIWAVIGLVQILCNCFIKNRRVKALAVVAIMLVIVLVPVFVIDAIYTGKVNDIREANGIGADTTVDKNTAGLEVKDYSEQLSYYHTHTAGPGSDGKMISLSDKLINRVESFCRVYNIPFYGDAKLAENNNFANQALYYDDFGFDYDNDGQVTFYTTALDASGNTIAVTQTVAAGEDGFANLDADGNPVTVINATEGDKGDAVLVNYSLGFENADTKKAAAANLREGTDTIYNYDSIKLVSKEDADGTKITATVKGKFYCVLYAQDTAIKYGSSATATVYNYIWYDDAKASYAITDGHYGKAYYNTNGLLSDGYIFSAEIALNILEEYYASQEAMKAAYDEYTAAEGGKSEDELKAETLTGATERLEARYLGADATEADKALYAREMAAADNYSLTYSRLNNVLSALGAALGYNNDLWMPVDSILGLAGTLGGALGIDLVSKLQTPIPLENILSLILGDVAAADLMKLLSVDMNNLTIDISANPLTLTVKKGSEEFDLVLDDTLSIENVEDLLKGIGITSPVLAKVLGLLGLTVAEGGTIGDMLVGLLETLYWYQSPVIDTAYDYYVNDALVTDSDNEKKNAQNAAIKKYQEAYSNYMRAAYEGGARGKMINSCLIGDSIGDGSYQASNGLTSLVEVQQMKTDLSYQTEMYSILIVRDMLMTFGAFIIFFTLMSYIAADREILYATGKIELKSKKGKKKKDEKEEPEEDTVPLAEENNEEEVH